MVSTRRSRDLYQSVEAALPEDAKEVTGRRGDAPTVTLVGVMVLALGLLGCIEVYTRPTLLIIGMVTVDIVDGKNVPGGAISYAAAVAKAYGIRAHIVTTSAPDTDMSVLDGHYVHEVVTGNTLTFEHTYTWWGNHRKLRVPARPNVTLTVDHVPWLWRRARTVLLGPLTPTDMDNPSFLKLTHARSISLLAQGLQRDTDAQGHVFAYNAPRDGLWESLDPRVSVYLSDVETDPWNPSELERMQSLCSKIVITKGEHGAEVMRGNETSLVQPNKVRAVDTNGAGDVFSTVFTIEESLGNADPAAAASFGASLAVQQPQSCKPWCAADHLAEHKFTDPHAGGGKGAGVAGGDGEAGEAVEGEEGDRPGQEL